MTTEPASWNALVAQVGATCDRAAFQALFAHFAPRLKAYLMRLGVPASQAEDLAQEALLLVWRKAALFDASKASASTWIFTIARNLRIDAIRRERRPAFDPVDFMPEEVESAEDGMCRGQDANGLRHALSLLPPDQAEVVNLSFFSDKPHSQIAGELGIPLGTVKSRLRLAMARLRGALGDEV